MKWKWTPVYLLTARKCLKRRWCWEVKIEKCSSFCISDQCVQDISTCVAAFGEQIEQECEIFSRLWVGLCDQRKCVCLNRSAIYSPPPKKKRKRKKENAEMLCKAQMLNTKYASEQWQRINELWSYNTMNEFKSLNASAVDFQLLTKV